MEKKRYLPFVYPLKESPPLNVGVGIPDIRSMTVTITGKETKRIILRCLEKERRSNVD